MCTKRRSESFNTAKHNPSLDVTLRLHNGGKAKNKMDRSCGGLCYIVANMLK